jgi:outer membrane protein
MKKILLITFLPLTCFLFNSYGQRKISWELALNILSENSIVLKQSELRERISKNNFQIAKGSIFPNLSFNLNNQHNMGMVFDQVSGKLITGNEWTSYGTGSFNSSIVLYQGGQKQNIIKGEKINIELADLDTERLKKELSLQLLSYFTQTLINHDLWEAGKSQLLMTKQQLDQEEAQVEVGKRTLIDLSQAKAKYANDNLNVVTTKNAYESSLMKLKLLLEMDESETIEVVGTDRLIKENIQPKYDLFNDPYLRLLNKQIELSEVKIKLARSTYFPTLSLNGSYGTNYSSQRRNIFSGNTIPIWNQFNQNRTLFGNVVISVPIFDNFRSRFNTKIAKLNKQDLLYEKEKLFRERKQAISQSFLDYQASQEELYAITAAFEANKINYTAIKERYIIGKSSSIDVYKALTELNISEFRLITAQHNVFYRKEILAILDD